MFDISFGELLLIGVVALVVLGPERLPTVARTIGALIGRLQRFVSSVKTDIQRETQLSGLAELQSDIQSAAQVFQHRIESELAEVRASTEALRSELSAAAQSAEQTLAEAKQAVQSEANAGEPAVAPTPAAEPAESAFPTSTSPLIAAAAYVPPTSVPTPPHP